MRTQYTVVSFFLVLGLGFAAIAAQEGPIIAVFDIQDKGSGIDKQTRDNLVDFLSARLAKAGYRVIPRDIQGVLRPVLPDRIGSRRAQQP